MKKISRLVIPAAVLFFASCDSDTGHEEQAVQNNAPAMNTPMPVTAPVTPAGSNNTAAPANTSSQTTALNPAHGEPGHRCDIAVGAPLNSTPTQGTQASPQPVTVNSAPTNLPPPVTSPTPVTVNPAPAPTTTAAPGTNPPHGQPGHDCSIAVGAPLKKK